MFEKSPPISPASELSAQPARFAEEPARDGAEPEASLRVMEWSELTARLTAARDLRRLLKSDRAASGNEFADAAARFLNPREESEADVNLVALEHSKGSQGMTIKPNRNSDYQPIDQGQAVSGSAVQDGNAQGYNPRDDRQGFQASGDPRED